jgi:hypothetical protein
VRLPDHHGGIVYDVALTVAEKRRGAEIGPRRKAEFAPGLLVTVIQAELASDASRSHHVSIATVAVHDRRHAVPSRKRRGKQIARIVPARDCIEEALNAVKDDPKLYVENAAQIAEMLKSAPAADAKAVTDARERLVRGSVLAGDDSAAWRLTPLPDGNAQPAAHLSNSQRNRLEWFNIELISRLLYPGTLRLAFTRNYVPNNLTSPSKTWRDVYHYDNTDRLTGWTRYDADKITNFTADGKVVPLLSLSCPSCCTL